MQLILKENVDSLGNIGDIVKVKGGYGRNYLIPRGKAVLANENNKRELEHHLRVIEKERKTALNAAKKLASTIEKTSVTVAKQVGEDEKIFGSVTTAELSELLINEGLQIDKKDISLSDDIKKVGVYSAQVKIHPEVQAKFKVWVVAQ